MVWSSTGSMYEHSSPRTFLLRRPVRGDQRGGPQHPLRPPAAGHERPDYPVGGVTRGDAVPAAALRADPAGRGALPVYQAVLRQSPADGGQAARRRFPAYPHWRLGGGPARLFAWPPAGNAEKISAVKADAARRLPAAVG